MRLSKVTIGIILFALFCQKSYAVPPPDFIIQAASQLVSFFTIWVVLLSGIYATGIQFLKVYYIQHKKIIWIIWIPSIFLLAGIGAYCANNYYQWIEQEKYTQSWIQSSLKNKHHTPSRISTNTGTIHSISWEGSNIGRVIWPIQPKNLDSVTKIMPLKTDSLIPNSKKSFIISNQELSDIIRTKSGDTLILDTREDLEYEIGHIPGSIHIRFADLKDGKWTEIAKNKNIIVVCWSGMRGKEVTEFLREKNIVSRYLEKWVNSWVNSGWIWEGEVKFSKIYGKANYSRIFSTHDVKSMQWITFIDARSVQLKPYKNILESINISMLSTPKKRFDMVFWKIKKWSQIIVICDEYINCFDAKMTGIELEKRWVTFLWRYNTPWEY